MKSHAFWVSIFFALVNLITGTANDSDVAIIVSSAYGAAALIIVGLDNG